MYYISAVILSVKLFRAKFDVKKFAISFLYYIALLIVIIIGSEADIMHDIMWLSMLVNVFLTRFCVKPIRSGTILSIYVFLFFVNSLVLSFVYIFFSQEQYEKMDIYIEFILNFLSMVCCILAGYTGINTKLCRILDCTSKAIKRLILSLTVCMTFMAALFLFLLPMYLSQSKKPTAYEIVMKILFISVIVIVMIIVFLLLAYSVSNKHIRNIADNFEKQIKAQSDYYVTLSKYNFDLRRFRHDYKNMCIGLRALISEEKYDQALEMLDNNAHVFDTGLVKFDTGNGIVNALLADKQRKADEIGTDIKFEGSLPPNMIDPADLCIIFGNTVDNALEACGKINTETEKQILIKSICNSGFVFINITNPVDKKVSMKGHIPKTSKPDKDMHGFGLYSVEKALKRYQGNLSLDCDDKNFCVSMELCMQNDRPPITDN